MSNLLERELNLKQTVDVIKKVRDLEGISWVFIKNIPFKDLKMSERRLIEQGERDYIARKLGVKTEELHSTPDILVGIDVAKTPLIEKQGQEKVRIAKKYQSELVGLLK